MTLQMLAKSVAGSRVEALLSGGLHLDRLHAIKRCPISPIGQRQQQNQLPFELQSQILNLAKAAFVCPAVWSNFSHGTPAELKLLLTLLLLPPQGAACCEAAHWHGGGCAPVLDCLTPLCAASSGGTDAITAAGQPVCCHIRPGCFANKSPRSAEEKMVATAPAVFPVRLRDLHLYVLAVVILKELPFPMVPGQSVNCLTLWFGMLLYGHHTHLSGDVRRYAADLKNGRRYASLSTSGEARFFTMVCVNATCEAFALKCPGTVKSETKTLQRQQLGAFTVMLCLIMPHVMIWENFPDECVYGAGAELYVTAFQLNPSLQHALVDNIVASLLPNLLTSGRRLHRSYTVGPTGSTSIQVVSALLVQMLQVTAQIVEWLFFRVWIFANGWQPASLARTHHLCRLLLSCSPAFWHKADLTQCKSSSNMCLARR